MDGVAINLHVALKPTSKFDGKKADEFLEWSSKLCASLRIYNNAFFNIFQGQERPSETDDGQATARAAWDAANHDLFQRIILFDGRLSLLRHTEIRQDTCGRGRTWTASLGSVAQNVQREFARSDSRGACQGEKHTNALRTGPRHHGQLPRPP